MAAARTGTTKLVAAFDHRDIFIAPSPDPQKSFRSAPRLFESAAVELARTMTDADLGRRRHLSALAKEITLSPERRPRSASTKPRPPRRR